MSRQSEAVRRAKYALAVAGVGTARPLTDSMFDLSLPGGGGLRAINSHSFGYTLATLHKLHEQPDRRDWSAVVFRWQKREWLVAMGLGDLARLVATTEQALVEAGRIGDIG